MTPMELPRPYPLDRLIRAASVTIDADPAECAAVARRLLVPSVAELHCEWTLAPEPGGVVAAHGRLRARLQQECVVSLDVFDVAVDEVFDVRFVAAGQESDAADDPDQPDEVPYENAALELGEATVEQLALSLDPYPRKPGAAVPNEFTGRADSPFAALARRLRPE